MKLKLRDYQREAIQELHAFLYKQGNYSGVVAIPTGGGKTFTAVAYCEMLVQKFRQVGKDLRIIWVAHRDELLSQAAEAFIRVNPKCHLTSWTSKKVLMDDGTRLPGPKNASGDVILTMINSSKNLPSAIDIEAKARHCQYIVVIDEAHHFAVGHTAETKYSNMYMKLIDRLQKAGTGDQPAVEKVIEIKDGTGPVQKIIGLTATPERLDKRPLGFQGIAYRISFLELVRRGFLAKPTYREMKSSFYAKLDVRGGDFTTQSLEKLNTPGRNMSIAREVIKNRWRYGKTLMFCCTRQHCKDMEHAMRVYASTHGIDDPPIRVIDGTNTKLERDEIQAWLDEGSPKVFKVLINCMVYTEGFDAPTLNSVVLARPTMSETLWMQMVGRGARIVRAQGTYPMSWFSEYPKPGEKGVFRSARDPAQVGEGLHVKTLKWGDPGIPVTSKTKPEDYITIEKAIKDSFNLTVVSDDITRFATLIKEWELHISPDKVDEKKEKERDKKKARKKKVKEVLADKRIKRVEGKLEEAQLVNVHGVLVFSTMYDTRIGIPMDDDRMDCVRGLNEFAKGCWIDAVDHIPTCSRPVDSDFRRLCTCPSRKIFDKDMFTQSYTYCVTSGALPSQLWTKLMWAYYFYYIRGKHRMVDKRTKKVAPTWEWIPVREISQDDRKKSRLRIKADMEQASADNAAFNANYAGREEIIKLFDEVFRHAMHSKRKVAAVGALNGVHGRIQRISARDRRIVCRTDIEIGGNRDEWIRRLFLFREIMTEALQEVLDDSCCMVQAVPSNSRLSQQEAFEFRPDSKFGRQMGSGIPSIPDVSI